MHSKRLPYTNARNFRIAGPRSRNFRFAHNSYAEDSILVGPDRDPARVMSTCRARCPCPISSALSLENPRQKHRWLMKGRVCEQVVWWSNSSSDLWSWLELNQSQGAHDRFFSIFIWEGQVWPHTSCITIIKYLFTKLITPKFVATLK